MLEEQIKDLIGQIDQQLRGNRKKAHVSFSVLTGDRHLRESADDVRESVRSYLDDSYPEYENEVRVDGHRRVEIRMRLRSA